MVLACNLPATDSQIDILSVNLIEKSEDTVASHDLTIEVIWLESLDLRKAIISIHLDFLSLTEVTKLW